MKKTSLRRIGILTAGGDCPGLNAVIRAATKTALWKYGLKVFGIEDGYEGLLEKRGRFLTMEDVSGILTEGGTILGTSNTANPFKIPIIRGDKVAYRDDSEKAIRNYKKFGLDALLVVGGDGTLKTAQKLFEKGIPVIGIPKTIDNDLEGTDYTFGFDTAVKIATDALDRLHTTAASHHRVMILEVMGRNAGWIALYAGSAGGADIILLPEKPFVFEKIREELKKRMRRHKRFSLIVVAEGAFEKGGHRIISHHDLRNPYSEKLGGVGNYLAKKIEKETGIEARAAVLGHIQRGGSPTHFDRNLGTLFGQSAVELLMKRDFGKMVCLKGRTIQSVWIHEAVHKLKNVPDHHPLVQAAASVGTSFGI